MSRKLWLPPTKLNEPGNVNRPLPRVRIQGVDPQSVVGQQLLAMFNGRIGQFHMAQAQKYMLGSVPIQRGTLDHPDVRMRYTNLQGQEIIDIQVNPKIVEELEKALPRYWDWALVDLTVPAPATGRFAAYMTIPTLYDIQPGDLMELQGVAIDDWSSYYPTLELENRNPVVYANPSHYDLLGTAMVADQVSSLRIDLRPFRGLPVVGVKLYGFIDPTGTFDRVFDSADMFISSWGREVRTDPTFGPVILPEPTQWLQQDDFADYFPETVGSGYVSSASPGGAADDGLFTWNAVWNGSSWEDPAKDPAVTRGQFAEVDDVEYYPNGQVKLRRYQGWRMWDPATGTYSSSPVAPVIGLNDFTAWDYVQMWGPIFRNIPVPSTGGRYCPVRGLLITGTPEWGVSKQDIADGWHYYRWEFAPSYPARPTLGLFPTEAAVPSGSYVDDPYNHFGMGFLGTILCDLKHGGISFSPA